MSATSLRRDESIRTSANAGISQYFGIVGGYDESGDTWKANRVNASGEQYVTFSERVDCDVWLEDKSSGKTAEIEPLGALKTVTPVRLVGTPFVNGTKDTTIWQETVTGSGSVTQAGEMLLSTGETADSSAEYITYAKARKIVGVANQFRCGARLTTLGTDKNVRRVGAFDDNNGIWFGFIDGVLCVGTRKSGTDTIISSGSFNGNLGASVIMDDSIQRLTIDYSSLGVSWYINGVLLHKISMQDTVYSSTLVLPITLENYNYGGNTIDNGFYVRFATILALGIIQTQPVSYHISGNAATHTLKQGAGVLHKVMYNNTSGTSLTIYDGLTVLGTITTTSTAIGEWSYDVPYYTSLRLVTVGNSLDATVLYE